MKKKFSSLLLCAALTLGISTASAWWGIRTRVKTTNIKVYGWVGNNYGRPIACQGHVYGRTHYGHVLSSWMNVVIPADATAGVYVHTSPQNPFVEGWGRVECRWY